MQADGLTINMKNEADNEETWKARGNQAFARMEYSKALMCYDKALELNPSAVLFANRAAVHLFQHNFPNVISDSARAIEIDPNCIKAYYRKACAFKETSQFTEALETISLGLAKDLENEDLISLQLEVLSEIQSNNILPCSHPEREKFDKLINWLIRGGAIFPKLHMRHYSEDYRGVHSTRNISKDECIIFIPKSHIITLEMAKQTRIGSQMFYLNLDLISPKHSFLSTFILQEQQNPQSFWRPYLNILPEKYANFPIFYSEEEKEWLAGSPFLDQVHEKVIDIEEDYKMICKAVAEFAKFDLHEFSKIRMAVSSRIFGMEIDGRVTDGFVPLADMLNHSRPRQTSWTYDQVRGGFIVESLQSIAKGAQIMDSYGKKCNSRFLLNYGFIVKNNDADEYPFHIKLDKNDGFFEVKKKLLKGPTSFVFRLQVRLDDPSFEEFLGTMRFIVLDDYFELTKLMEEFPEATHIEPHRIKVISVKNEQKVLENIKSLAEMALSAYPDTLQDDLELLETDLTENHRNCVLIRYGEKRILHFFSNMADELLPCLGKPISESGIKDLMDKYQEYILTSVLPLEKSKQPNNP